MNHWDYFKKIMEAKANADATATVEWLRESGILDDKDVMRYVIRDEYYKRLKGGERSCFDVKLDLAVDFDVSDSFVKNAIYHYTHLKV